MNANGILKGVTARWVVTGAAGFIGSHLVKTLLQAGHEVVGVDNFVTGKRENVAAARHRDTAGFRFIQGDIADASVARDAVRNCDYVLHQAALGSVPRSIENPMATFASNVQGFMQILEAARCASVKAFVFASSSSVYGDHPGLPKVEQATGAPLSPYAASKSIDEMVAAVFSRCYQIRTVGLRYFNVFGARQDPDGAYAAVIPRWIAAMVRGEPVVIHGDGTNSRDFCYIDNVVQANLKAALRAPELPPGSVLNVAVGERTSLLDLYAVLRRMLAERLPGMRAAPPVFGDARPGDVRHSLADISLARRLIDYEPTHDLSQGLAEALDWYLEQLADCRST